MKRLIFAALALGGVALAQQVAPVQPKNGADPALVASTTVRGRLIPVTRNDLYCSGFLTKEKVDGLHVVSGGLESPNATRFVRGDLIFLKGATYQPGNRVSIVREYRSPDRVELYKGAKKLLKEAGQPYFDLGYARVIEIRGELAVAKIEFSCDSIDVGDLVIPFVERPQVMVRDHSTMDRFPTTESDLNGKVVLAGESDQFATSGRKVYLNLGWQQGVKVGDYFRVTRSYSPDETDESDRGAYAKSEVDDTQKHELKLSKKQYEEMPRRVLGEIVVLSATQTSSTAMVTFMLEPMHSGDVVEREVPQN